MRTVRDPLSMVQVIAKPSLGVITLIGDDLGEEESVDEDEDEG